METIALDAHFTTFPCSLALEWMNLAGEELFAQRVQKMRDLLGANEKDTLVFTSSGAEAINQVLWSVFYEVVRKTGKTHLITSCLEDAPVLQMMRRLEELGCFVKIVSVNERGEIDLDHLRSLMSPRTALLSFGMAQALTGVIQPIDEIAQIARENNVLLHLDASYTFGKYALSSAADYLTFSGDCIHSIPSTGAILTKADSPLVPLVLGAKSNPSSAAALCAAAYQASLFLDAMSLEVVRLRDRFEQELAQRCGAQIAFSQSLRLPNTSTLLFPRVHQETLFYFLRQKKVLASIGGDYTQSLCSLLTASKYSEETAQTAVSFSLSRMTEEEEVMRAVETIDGIVSSLRKLSEDL